jgi:hypothetical protein
MTVGLFGVGMVGSILGSEKPGKFAVRFQREESLVNDLGYPDTPCAKSPKLFIRAQLAGRACVFAAQGCGGG